MLSGHGPGPPHTKTGEGRHAVSAATAITWLNTAASSVVQVDPGLSSYQAQVQVVVVVHVAQQVQPPGAITTALADVQVAPTLPV